MEDYKIGFTRTYIQDHPFNFLCEIPAEAAVSWVQQLLPDAPMGCTGSPAHEMTLDGNTGTDARVNGWLNKRFIIVAVKHNGKYLALVNWDGRFSIYEQR